ncbi:MAG TPA: hypothetical protein DDX71_08115 [Ruminococcus sp.]|nr:hypothetical protein [Ruminococcus sp.]
MNILSRFAAGAVAVLTASSIFAGTTVLRAAAAETKQELIGYYGDISGDLEVDWLDIFLMEDFLLYGTEEDEVLWQYADLDDSNSVDARDLTLLMQLVLNGEKGTADYREVPFTEELIPPPIQALSPTMPSVGEARVLMVAVDFPECEHDAKYTAEYLQEMCFGAENPQSPWYPVESISAYYKRASYDRLNLTGTTYTYTASHYCDYYAGKAELLMVEVLGALDSQIDYREFDVNKNGTLDTLLLALPKGAVGRDANKDGTQDWWPCSGSYYTSSKFDGIKPGNLCIGAWDLEDVPGFNSTWIHELGHAMGLPDYYKYVNNEDGYYGLEGHAGWEMMDDAYCDMSSFSKLMYGWFKEDEVQIYTGGTQTFTLESLQKTPSCILIPRGDLDGFYSEYFMIEFNSVEGNDKAWFSGGKSYTPFWRGGVRVLHCNAELWNGYWGIELKWNNYGQMYDTSNQKQRVLRLVNNNHDFFRNDAVIDSSIDGFAWYDDEGNRTIDPGLTIRVSDFVDGSGCTITISENA